MTARNVMGAGLLTLGLMWGASAQAETAADAPQGRGLARSALLTRLMGGERVVTLDVTDRQPDTTEPLRLDEAVALTLKNNFEVKASGAKTEASGWELATAYAGYLPTVSFSTSTGREKSAPASYSINDKRVEYNEHRRRDKVLNVVQPLVDLNLISDVLMRTQSKESADLEQLSTRERTALDTVASYLGILQAHLFIRFAEGYKQRLDSLNSLMAQRVEGGGAAQADLDRIKARSVSAQSAIIETRSSFVAAMDEFRRLTGTTPQKLQIPAVLLPVLPDTVDVALNRAMAANPDYRLSLSQVDVQEWEAMKAFSRALPKLTFEYTKSRSWNAGGAALGASASGGDEVFPYQNETRLMLVASWTLSGGSELTQGMTASAKAREASYKSMDTRMRVEELVRIGVNSLTAADMRVPVLEQALESNARVVEAFEEQYRNGNRPLFDLLDAYERHYSSQLDLVRVLLAEARAAYQLRRNMGELVPALKESEIRAEAGGN